MPYEHLMLKRWPFPVVPDPRYCDFIADREQFRKDIDGLLRTMTRQDASSIHLLWSWYGAGKTHTLFYFAKQAKQISDQENQRVHTVYSEFPKSTRSFVDLYRSFAIGLDPDEVVDAYLEIRTSQEGERLHKQLLQTSPDLVNALQVLLSGTDSDQGTALRWLRGEALPIADFRRIGILQKITTSEEAGRIFSALIHLYGLASESEGKPMCRVVWLLDEFQRIEKLPGRVRDEIGVGLHSTFNACPSGLSIVLSFSGRPQEKLPDWFSSELRDRIGRTKVLVLPPLVTEQAMDFVKDILSNLRTLEGWNAPPYFPFTEEACRFVIEEMLQRNEELKPRNIMHAFNAVLQEGDALLEAGEMAELTPTFAKGVLAEYVSPPELEEP